MPITAGAGAAIAGVTSVIGALGGAKMQSGAAGRAAKLQTDAANKAALLQDAAAKRALMFTQNQSFLDEVRANATSRARYSADVADLKNTYAAAGDLSFNNRAAYLSKGRTDDKLYGEKITQLNSLKDMLGYGQPHGATSVFVAPEELRQSPLNIPTEQVYSTPVNQANINPATGLQMTDVTYDEYGNVRYL